MKIRKNRCTGWGMAPLVFHPYQITGGPEPDMGRAQVISC
jgi:hypothetical protein